MTNQFGEWQNARKVITITMIMRPKNVKFNGILSYSDVHIPQKGLNTMKNTEITNRVE